MMKLVLKVKKGNTLISPHSRLSICLYITENYETTGIDKISFAMTKDNCRRAQNLIPIKLYRAKESTVTSLNVQHNRIQS